MSTGDTTAMNTGTMNTMMTTIESVIKGAKPASSFAVLYRFKTPAYLGNEK